MYIKKVLAFLFVVHAVNAVLKCHVCESTQSGSSCATGGSGVPSVQCETGGPLVTLTCLEYKDNANGTLKYVRKCDGNSPKTPCERMKEKNLPYCHSCSKNNCNSSSM